MFSESDNVYWGNFTMRGHRKPANSRGDKRSFTRNAMKQHVKNMPSRPMRGGIRL